MKLTPTQLGQGFDDADDGCNNSLRKNDGNEGIGINFEGVLSLNLGN